MATNMTYQALVDDYEVLRSLGIAGVLVNSSDKEIDADKGLICAKKSLMDSRAYAGRKNPNTWNMKAATASDTEVYVCAPQITDVAKNTNGNVAYVGANTLMITAPAGIITRYEKLVPGYMYAFGSGCFSTAPDTSKKFATIADGKLVATATEPTSGVYFKIDEAVNFAEGTRKSLSGYRVTFCRAYGTAATQTEDKG